MLQDINATIADLEFTNPLGINPTYSNFAALFATLHDVRMVFSEIITDKINAKPRLELRASVAFSTSQAVLLIKALQEAVENQKKLVDSQKK